MTISKFCPFDLFQIISMNPVMQNWDWLYPEHIISPIKQSQTNLENKQGKTAKNQD